MSARTKAFPVGASGVLAAGLVSAAALFISRFGVAGTIVGVALTTMTIGWLLRAAPLPKSDR